MQDLGGHGDGPVPVVRAGPSLLVRRRGWPAVVGLDGDRLVALVVSGQDFLVGVDPAQVRNPNRLSSSSTAPPMKATMAAIQAIWPILENA